MTKCMIVGTALHNTGVVFHVYYFHGLGYKARPRTGPAPGREGCVQDLQQALDISG